MMWYSFCGKERDMAKLTATVSEVSGCITRGDSCPYLLFHRSRGISHEDPRAQESQAQLVARIANSRRGPITIRSRSALCVEEGNGHACRGIHTVMIASRTFSAATASARYFTFASCIAISSSFDHIEPSLRLKLRVFLSDSATSSWG